jgi:tetratricopeptide (TPR) repeat protein
LSAACSYLPLALRVSASLLLNDDTLAVADYLTRLADTRTRLEALRDPEDPQLDVMALLQLSVAALPPAVQDGLVQLSVFAGSFDAPAADAVVALPDAGASRTLLSTLRRQNLLEHDPATSRYQLHDLVHAFVRRTLPNQGLVWQRYVRYYTQHARQASDDYREGGDVMLVALAAFDREAAHVRHAWSWLADQAVTPEIDRQILDLALGTVLLSELRFVSREERLAIVSRARAAAERLQDWEALISCLIHLGRTYRDARDLPAAIACLEQALAIAQSDPRRSAEAVIFEKLAEAFIFQGEQRKRLTQLHQALAASGGQITAGVCLATLNTLYLRQGQIVAAITVLEQALTVTRQGATSRAAAWRSAALGMVAMATGDLARASSQLQQSLELARAQMDAALETTQRLTAPCRAPQ